MGRKATTGRFPTREELVEHVHKLYRVEKCTLTDVAKACRISVPTVSKILKEKVNGATKPALRSSTNGTAPKKRNSKNVQKEKWCSCWQKVDGIKRIPYQGRILQDHGGWYKLEVNGEVFTVNRGACGTPFER